MITIISTILSAIIPILLKYLSDSMDVNTEQKESRDDLRAINKAKDGVEVNTVWKRHDNRVEQLLRKAKAKRSKR